MNIRRSIFMVGSLAIALLLIILFVKRPAQKRTQSNDSTAVESEASAIEAEKQRARLGRTNTSSISLTNVSVQQSPIKTTVEKMREGLATLNDVPIVFYGKIEDQFGSPVNGAEITGSVMIRNGVTQGTTTISTIISDANGLFTIAGYKGERLSFKPKKAGYAIASLNCGGIYSAMYPEEQRVHPDPNNPTVIIMWKLQGEEPLVRFGQNYKLHYTDKPIHFDLLTGKTVPKDGDIEITVSRSSGIVSERTMQDWSVKVEAVNGGLVDSFGQEEVTYWAPEAGYQQSDILTFSTNAPYKWSGSFSKGFFVRSRNGQVYSKLGLSFGINQKPDGLMYVTLSGIANTNGSRNWEGDPNIAKPQ